MFRSDPRDVWVMSPHARDIAHGALPTVDRKLGVSGRSRHQVEEVQYVKLAKLRSVVQSNQHRGCLWVAWFPTDPPAQQVQSLWRHSPGITLDIRQHFIQGDLAID